MMVQITLGGQKISLKLSVSFKILSREAVELNSCLSLVRSSFVIVSLFHYSEALIHREK